ncbi:MAG: hypothetical protein R3272_16905, partial [Candidatus Promineifilaceae bacterium]|nr:hypothetical protein [Candidatus Promineifilaceae bacterium]
MLGENGYRARKFFSCISLLVILTGCRPEAVPRAVVVVAETATPLPPTPPPTATPPPTEALAPTATATAEAAPSATARPPVEARFEPAACRFEVPAGRDVDCGYLVVPENRDAPEPDDLLRLHVARFRSESASPAPDPIVYLEGGPGGDALEMVPFAFEDSFAPFLAERDFIIFDQRGTGYSLPSLAWQEYTALSLELLDDILAPEDAFSQQMEALRRCRERVAE